MRFAKLSKLQLAGAAMSSVALFVLTVAMASLTLSSAQATPAIAKASRAAPVMRDRRRASVT
jgi:hypothetical protein